MFSMPLAYPSTLDRRLSAARAEVVAVLRGGALEPESLSFEINCMAKSPRNLQRWLQRRAQKAFLSQAGPRYRFILFKLSITLSIEVPETTKATRWVALARAAIW